MLTSNYLIMEFLNKYFVEVCLKDYATINKIMGGTKMGKHKKAPKAL